MAPAAAIETRRLRIHVAMKLKIARSNQTIAPRHFIVRMHDRCDSWWLPSYSPLRESPSSPILWAICRQETAQQVSFSVGCRMRSSKAFAFAFFSFAVFCCRLFGTRVLCVNSKYSDKIILQGHPGDTLIFVNEDRCLCSCHFVLSFFYGYQY